MNEKRKNGEHKKWESKLSNGGSEGGKDGEKKQEH